MKTSKADAQKKSAKKTVKKELQKNLTNKFFEAVKSLGHDAEMIGEDLVLVSKFVAKKIAKKVTGAKKNGGKKVNEVASAVAGAVGKTAEKPTTKGTKKAEKTAMKGAAKPKRVVNSVQVTGLASEEKLAQVLSKPKPAGSVKAKKAEKAPISKSSAPKLTPKKGGATE